MSKWIVDIHGDIEGDYEIIEEYKEPCEDAISRQAVLEYIEGNEADLWHKSENELVCQDIKALPPVTPQPKTGHWITTRTFMHYGEFYCDKCKCDAPNNEKWDYCPNCGVKMQEEEE